MDTVEEHTIRLKSEGENPLVAVQNGRDFAHCKSSNGRNIWHRKWFRHPSVGFQALRIDHASDRDKKSGASTSHFGDEVSELARIVSC